MDKTTVEGASFLSLSLSQRMGNESALSIRFFFNGSTNEKLWKAMIRDFLVGKQILPSAQKKREQNDDMNSQ
jgi:hypothetical protein